MDAPCIFCERIVTRRMHAVECENCHGWQHKRCNTGISSAEYKLMVQNRLQRHWLCGPCSARARLPAFVAAEADDEVIAEEVRPQEEDDVSIETESGLQQREIPDNSFNVEDRDIEPNVPVLDRTIQDPVLDDVEVDEFQTVTYTEVEGGSKKGGRVLASSDGFTYSIKRGKPDFIYWRCTARGRKPPCLAVVKQYGDAYIRGPREHNHQADPGARVKTVIYAKAKQLAKEQVLRPAADIAETVMKDVCQPGDHGLPKMDNLTRAVNFCRGNLRPKEPQSKDFELHEGFIRADEFLVKDIHTEDRERHIILATESQLRHLQSATRWFIDGTFKIVRKPFQQLLTIHAFIKNGNCVKQLPLAFCLMTRRTRQDYVEVFQALRNAMPKNPAVEWFMMDFETAAWQAVREVFHHTIQKGCVFHFTQALYRKILAVGLSAAYIEREDKYRYLRKVMSLPFLPAEHIRQAFEVLEDQAQESGHQSLMEFISYVRATWFDGPIWRPENLSVFQQTVRTNNDVEEWHHRINGRVGQVGAAFYVLVPLLLQEAETVELNIQLVTEQSLTRYQRVTYKKMHARLFKLWEDYEDNTPALTTSKLLREVSYIVGFAPLPARHDEEVTDQ